MQSVETSDEETSPLSVNQRGVWIAQQLELSSSSLHGGWAVRVQSELSCDAFRRAWQGFTDRHAMARASFQDTRTGPIQRIRRNVVADFALVDASATSEVALDQLVSAAVAQRFDLSLGALRARVFARSPTDHVILVVAHHIAFDFASLEVMAEELASLYVAAVEGRSDAGLPPLALDYLDYVRWQSEYLASSEGREGMAFWLGVLRDAPTAVDLPIDRPRRPVRRSVGAAYVTPLDGEVVRVLRTLNRSLFRTLLTAFEATVHRFTGQSDVLTGTAASVRPSAAYAGVVGNFVNMLPLRFDVGGDPTGRELLARVDIHLAEASKHRHVPLLTVLEELRLRRDPSSTPLFQMSMGMQRAGRSQAMVRHLLGVARPDGDSESFAGLRSVPYAVRQHLGQLDLELVCVDDGEHVSAEFKFNTDVFERTTIERIAESFTVLLEAFAADPQQPLSSLPVMSESERQRLLVEWNATTTSYPRDACLHDLFSEVARRQPDAIAVVDDGEQITYGEANRRSDALAAALLAQGVGAGSIVALCVPRSVRGVLSMLGILKAGAAYLPLESHLPEARMTAVLADADVRFAVVDAAHAGLPGLQSVAILVAEECLSADPFPEGSPRSVGDSADLAYVIYTSGSTGTPKGVLVEHRSVVNTATWMQRAFEVGPGVRATQTCSYSFDGSVAEIWPVLISGATMYIVSDELRRSPADVVQWLRRSRIEVACFATPLAERCIAESVRVSLPDLRVMMTGGDKLQWPQTMPAYALVNLYGPTECTVNATFAWVDRNANDKPIPIGRPIANARIYILDVNMAPVPIGARGEIFVGGECVARGYLNRPELEQEKFVHDPFSRLPGARLYRTGDLAKYRANGEIEFVGRVDHQVKIRGFRVELGEIEVALSGYPGVRQSLVVAHEGMNGQTSIVAYVSPASPQSVDQLAVRGYLAARLPEYMTPSSFMILDEFPLTANGKVDHGRLPEPVWRSSRQIEPPANPTEEKLLSAWRRMLNNDSIGVTDDFFEAGGDSLLAMRLHAAVEEAFARRLTMLDVLRAPTVRAQATTLTDRESAETGAAPAEPRVVVLADGPQPPLILLHAVGGGIAPYRALASELGPQRAVWAVASPTHGAAGSSIERIAASYADALEVLLPQGSLLLGGWSLGGGLAMAVAHELRQRRRTVDFLMLIDSPYPRSLTITEPELFRRFIDDSFAVHKLHVDAGGDTEAMLELAVAQLLSGSPPGASSAAAVRRDLRAAYELFRDHAFALHAYKPPRWAECLHYLRAADRGASVQHLREGEPALAMEDATTAWQTVADDLRVADAGGNHFTMLTAPHVQGLRAIIAGLLPR